MRTQESGFPLFQALRTSARPTQDAARSARWKCLAKGGPLGALVTTLILGLFVLPALYLRRSFWSQPEPSLDPVPAAADTTATMRSLRSKPVHQWPRGPRAPLGLAFLTVLFAAACAAASPTAQSTAAAPASPTRQPWIREFDLSSRKLATTGEAPFFVLRPGFQLVLASATEELTITVLAETREIGGIMTRVIEERETERGSLTEISRNFFAMDSETGDVFYFGEEVDMYSGGRLTTHSGAWLAFEGDNRPGMIMPGSPKVGMKYYQEMAPGVATDRARVISVSETISTRAGDFENCLVTQESSDTEPGAVEYKTYCPGIGLVQDQGLTLVSAQDVQ